ncbi:MAG: porin, partial [Sphingomonadaceae bacterium]
MKTYLLFSGVALLAVTTPSFAKDEVGPEAYPVSSGLDTPIDDAAAADAPAATGDAVLDRLNQLEARIRQLEARNAQLEAQNAEVQTSVENVEVRSATAVQPEPAPTFSDVDGKFTFKPRGTIQIDYAAYNERARGYDYSNGTDIRRARFGFDGTYGKFKWRLDAEYLKGVASLLDAYLQYPLSSKLSITVGQHKAPYGLEANSTDALNTFLERGMASNAFGAVGAER